MSPEECWNSLPCCWPEPSVVSRTLAQIHQENECRCTLQTDSLAQATGLHRDHGMGWGGEGRMVEWVAQVLLGAVSHPPWLPVNAEYRKGTGGPLNSK